MPRYVYARGYYGPAWHRIKHSYPIRWRKPLPKDKEAARKERRRRLYYRRQRYRAVMGYAAYRCGGRRVAGSTRYYYRPVGFR